MSFLGLKEGAERCHDLRGDPSPILTHTVPNDRTHAECLPNCSKILDYIGYGANCRQVASAHEGRTPTLVGNVVGSDPIAVEVLASNEIDPSEPSVVTHDEYFVASHAVTGIAALNPRCTSDFTLMALAGHFRY